MTVKHAPGHLKKQFLCHRGATVFARGEIMGHVICIASQKGGVGKTTTAVHLAASLAVAERRTLLVDCDPQANATSALGMKKLRCDVSLETVLRGLWPMEGAIRPTAVQGLEMVPSRMELFRLEAQWGVEASRKAGALGTALEPVRSGYDFVVFDTPPSLGILTINAMMASDFVVIPMPPHTWAAEGTARVLDATSFLRRRFAASVRVLGVLLTMMDQDGEAARRFGLRMRKSLQRAVFETVIPWDRDLQAGGKTALLPWSDVLSAPVQGYLTLAGEVLRLLEGCSEN